VKVARLRCWTLRRVITLQVTLIVALAFTVMIGALFTRLKRTDVDSRIYVPSLVGDWHVVGTPQTAESCSVHTRCQPGARTGPLVGVTRLLLDFTLPRCYDVVARCAGYALRRSYKTLLHSVTGLD